MGSGWQQTGGSRSVCRKPESSSWRTDPETGGLQHRRRGSCQSFEWSEYLYGRKHSAASDSDQQRRKRKNHSGSGRSRRLGSSNWKCTGRTAGSESRLFQSRGSHQKDSGGPQSVYRCVCKSTGRCKEQRRNRAAGHRAGERRRLRKKDRGSDCRPYV